MKYLDSNEIEIKFGDKLKGENPDLKLTADSIQHDEDGREFMKLNYDGYENAFVTCYPEDSNKFTII